MKIATAALALALVFASSAACAADTPAKQLTPQQQRMKDCNAQGKGKHGDERRAFMSTCLKGGATATAGAKPAAAKAKSAAATAGKR